MQSSVDLEQGSGGQDNGLENLARSNTTRCLSGVIYKDKSKDWTSCLGSNSNNSNIEVLDFCSGSSQWTVVPSAKIENPSKLPESVLIRLFLLEGLTLENISYFNHISDEFFHYHSLNVLPYDLSGVGSNSFFAKWPRRVDQDQHQRDIEDRIAKGRPYSLDLGIDPKEIKVEHDRYEREPGIYRPYSSLEPNTQSKSNTKRECISQAVMECISTNYKRDGAGLIGELFFQGLVNSVPTLIFELLRSNRIRCTSQGASYPRG